jgi:hypothetical protein
MPITSNSDLLSRPAWKEGRIWDMYDCTTDTGFTEMASTIIPFGFAVCQGTAYNGLILPVDTDSVFKGFAVYSDTFEQRASITVNSDNRMGYPALNADIIPTMTYLSLGRIAVPCSTAMAISASVFFVYTADGAVTGERVGMVRNSANSSKAKQITNARVIEPATAAGIVVLELY